MAKLASTDFGNGNGIFVPIRRLARLILLQRSERAAAETFAAK